jgi:pimeloyl-ACP methyl ester carboxylesterase
MKPLRQGWSKSDSGKLLADMSSRHHIRIICIRLIIMAIACGGVACGWKSPAEAAAAMVQGGDYRIHTQVFAARQVSETPALVVVLHGDAPRGKPDYHYRFAAAVAERNADVVAVGLLRPGYVDPAGNRSDGVRGLTTGDNYNARNTDSIAAAISELERRWHARKVVVVGHSGGAALTANILGRHPAVIDAAVLVSCPCDVAKWRAHMHEVQGWSGWLEKIETVSPIDVVPGIANGVPVRMLVGTRDDVTPPSLSLAYEAAAKRLGNDVKLVQLDGVDHEALFDPAVFDTVAQLVGPAANVPD